MLWLAGLAFSKLGLFGLGGLLIAGAVASLWLRLPNAVTIGFAVAAAVHIYSGSIWQAAQGQVEARVRAAVAEEARRQGEASAHAIGILEDQLATAEADQATAEKAAADLQTLIASRPPVAGRGATAEDIRALH